MLDGIRALRLTALDFWEESFIVLGTGLVGGLLSLLLLPVPFVLAAHYGSAERITEERIVTWRIWLQCGRKHAPFFYKWMLLVVLVSVILAGNIAFYQRLDASWAAPVSWFMVSLLGLWLLPQPLVPALYFRQADRRLRVALRNAAVLTLTDPLSIIVLWLALIVLAIPLGYIAWPLLLLLPVMMALLGTRLVRLRLKHLSGPPQS
jgi:hypothetical protein